MGNRLNSKSGMHRWQRQRGIALIQAVIVVGLLSFMTVRMIPIKDDYFKTRFVIAPTRTGIEQLAQAAVAYRTDESAAANAWRGTWPVDPNTIDSRGYIPGFSNRNGRGNPYVFSIAGSALRISTDMDSTEEARVIAASFGAIAAVSGNTVSVTIPVPGQESTHSQLYALDGSRALTGAMDANGQNINNIGTATATQFSATTDMRAPLYYDADNTSYYANPAGTSKFSRIDASSQMRAPIYYDSQNTAFYLDPASNSRLWHVDASFLTLREDYTEGTPCTMKTVGTTSRGALLSCEESWGVKPGGSQVEVSSGTAGNAGYVGPISGYTRAQCTLSLHGKPSEEDGGYKRSRHFSHWHSDSGSGWTVYASQRGVQDGALLEVTNATIQYQLICTK